LIKGADMAQEEVLTWLQGCLSGEDNIRKPAEQKIFSLEANPNFLLVLLDIASNSRIPLNIRFLSVLCVKNAVGRQWRFMDEQAKGKIRGVLLSLVKIDSHDKKLLPDIANTISKISRDDFPEKWGTLIEDLMVVITSGNIPEYQVTNTLIILQKVVATLASKRLLFQRKQFHEVSVSLLTKYRIAQLWASQCEATLGHLSKYFSSQLSEELLLEKIGMGKRTSLLLKILSDVMVYGNLAIDSQEIKVILERQLMFFKHITDANQAMKHPFIKVLTECASTTIKITTALQKEKPHIFRKMYLESCLKTYLPLIMEQPKNNKLHNEIIILSMEFIQKIVIDSHYRLLRSNADKEAVEGNKLISSLFTPEVLVNLCKQLICRYFVMSKEELEEWENDPEEFIRQAEVDTWADNLKASAENLYMFLLQRFGDGCADGDFKLAPAVVQLLQDIMKQNYNSEMEVALVKDACYRALGLASFDLYDYVDFPSWFRNVLGEEIISSKGGVQKIIRKRVAWLIPKWNSKIDDSIRVDVYKAIIGLMQEEDIAVAVISANSLSEVLTDLSFNVNAFLPFLDTTISSLFKLLVKLEQCETKLIVLKVISVVLEQLADHVQPYANNFLQCFQALWKESEDHNLLQTSIVTALTNLVKDAKGMNGAFYSGFIPGVINYGTQIDAPQSLYLLEDCLLLWEETLRQIPELTDELLAIYPQVAKVIENNYNNVKSCMKIMKRYFVLANNEFLEQHLKGTLVVIDSLIGNLKEEGVMVVIDVVDILVQILPSQIPPLIPNTLKHIFSLTVEASKEDSRLFKITRCALSLFARILLQNPSFFVQFFSELSRSTNQNLLLPFVELWLKELDGMEKYAQKLSGLALCNLLPAGSELLGPLQLQVVNAIVMVILSSESKHGYDAFVVQVENLQAASTLVKKTQLLYAKDPVNVLNIRSYAMEKLKEYSERHPEQFQNFIKTLNPQALETLQKKA